MVKRQGMALLIYSMVLLLKDTSQRMKVGEKLPCVTTVRCGFVFPLSTEKTWWVRRDKNPVNRTVSYTTPHYIKYNDAKDTPTVSLSQIKMSVMEVSQRNYPYVQCWLNVTHRVSLILDDDLIRDMTLHQTIKVTVRGNHWNMAEVWIKIIQKAKSALLKIIKQSMKSFCIQLILHTSEHRAAMKIYTTCKTVKRNSLTMSRKGSFSWVKTQI